jgi:hypothetical protein
VISGRQLAPSAQRTQHDDSADVSLFESTAAELPAKPTAIVAIHAGITASFPHSCLKTGHSAHDLDGFGFWADDGQLGSNSTCLVSR